MAKVMLPMLTLMSMLMLISKLPGTGVRETECFAPAACGTWASALLLSRLSVSSFVFHFYNAANDFGAQNLTSHFLETCAFVRL